MTGLVARELAALTETAAKKAKASAAPSGDGRPTRSALTAAIAAARYEGISRTYAFDEKRQQVIGQDAHLYRVEKGRHRYLGPAPKPES